MKYTNKIIIFLVFLTIFSCSEDTESDWKKIKSETAPAIRFDSCSFYRIKNNSFYILAGRASENRIYNDIWRFDLSSEQWSSVTTPTGTKIDSGGRMNYCSYDNKNDILYLYGINGSGNTLPSNILKWTLKDNKMEEIALSSLPDTSLRGHSLTLLKSKLAEPSLIIFGGEDTGNTLNNDIRIFSLVSKTFEKLEVSGEKPLARMNHTAILSSDNKLIIIGGKSNSGALNDAWSFDFTTKKWEKLSSATLLKGYYNSNFYNESDNSVIFYGGKDLNGNISNFLKYDISNNTWKEIDSSPEPGSLSGASIMLSSDNKFYLFGGSLINDKNESVSVNETWKYQGIK